MGLIDPSTRGQPPGPARFGPRVGRTDQQRRNAHLKPETGVPASAARPSTPCLMAEIDSFYPTVFQTNWEHALQQGDSRLAPTVSEASFTGDRKWFNLIEDAEMHDVTTRKGDTPDGEFEGTKYWLAHRPKEIVTIFDEWDQAFLGDVVLPTSDTVAQHAKGYNRALDAVIATAFDATRYIGEDGTSADEFPDAQHVPVDYVESGDEIDSGLTVGKVREAQFLMDYAEVPETDRYFACTAKQKQDILRTTEVTSRDYAEVQALVHGQIDLFLGFKFVMYNRFTTLAPNVRRCFAYHKSAIKTSVHARKVHMDPLPNKRHALQIRTVAMMGAVRTQNGLVVRVACHEAP